VVIRPFLGKLTQVSGSIPHPKGEVSVSLSLRGEKLGAEVSLPKVSKESLFGVRRDGCSPLASRSWCFLTRNLGTPGERHYPLSTVNCSLSCSEGLSLRTTLREKQRTVDSGQCRADRRKVDHHGESTFASDPGGDRWR